jgi:hypothetical protein
MENDNKELSDGAKAVLSLFKGEPTVPRLKTIDPRIVDEPIAMIDTAGQYTDRNMPWLHGVYLTFDQVDSIRDISRGIRAALESGAQYEADFYDGVKQSKNARDNFVELMLKKTEDGSLELGGCNKSERGDDDEHTTNSVP